MTSRVFTFLTAPVLVSLTFVAFSGCGKGGRDIIPYDGGMGGGGNGTTSSTTSTTSSTTTSTGTGGMGTGGMGTGGMGTGGNMACANGMKDGDETDVDCGGMCLACGKNKACMKGLDCISGTCLGGQCTDPCQDGKIDGDETDIDCGGATCVACVTNQTCKAPGDCQSLSCKNGKCQAATCTDGVKNANETGVDCGGLLCMPCPAGVSCLIDKDCDSKVCDPVTKKCNAPDCNDGVQNGTESDIDCGGSCPKCNPGQKCNNAADCVGQSCAVTCQCPPGMLVVPVQGGGIYCIDATEVSYTDYQKFYNANPPTQSQPPYCTWNQNYTPGGDWPPLPNQAQEPVRYVNWCQADAYCRYNQRRLCGAIGGGHVSPAAANDFHQDQWLNACSAQGNPNNVYPYGPNYIGGLCNGAILNGGPTQPTNFFNCVGGVPGLLQMSGNVAEWEDSCDGYTNVTDACGVRGGSFSSSSAALSCSSGGTLATKPRNYQGKEVGFRCCL